MGVSGPQMQMASNTIRGNVMLDAGRKGWRLRPNSCARSCLLVLTLSVGGCARPDAVPARHTLVVAYGADEYPLSINRTRLGRYPLNAGICEPLVRLTQTFGVAPALASRWERYGDNTVRFVLRSGITFSNGSPVDARAVAFSLGYAARTRADYSFVSDSAVRIMDDTTFEVTPTHLNRRLIDQLVHPIYSVLDRANDPAVMPVCTGPFRLAEYVAHNHLTVVRNTRYRGEPSLLDTVIFRFIQDETTRMLALRAGEVDAIFDVSRSNAKALRETPGLRVVTAPPGAVLVMYLNINGDAPYHQLRDSILRRAVAMSIDRRTLVDNVLGGNEYASHVATVNPPGVLRAYASRVHGVSYDVQRATQLLNGQPRTLRLIANPNSVDRATVEFVQAQLASVGIHTVVEQLDAAAYESRLNAGAFDLDIEQPSQNDANPSFLLAIRWYSKSSTRSARFTHASLLFDTLVERALAADTDDDARRAAADAMHQLVDVEVAAIPLAGISRTYAMTDRVRGFVAHPSRLNQDWSRVWLAR